MFATLSWLQEAEVLPKADEGAKGFKGLLACFTGWLLFMALPQTMDDPRRFEGDQRELARQLAYITPDKLKYWEYWSWMIWHYISAFGVMFAVLSWFQESKILTDAEDLKGWKGFIAVWTGLALYILDPHQMIDPRPPMDGSGTEEENQHTCVVPRKIRTLRGMLWEIWHYISAFGVMFAVLSWLQESSVLPDHKDLKGWKGLIAVITGAILHFIMPQVMTDPRKPFVPLERVTDDSGKWATQGTIFGWYTLNVRYYTHWAWLLWHYISAFGVMFAALSWLQESHVLEEAKTFEGRKGFAACISGLVLFLIMPQVMTDPRPQYGLPKAAEIKFNAIQKTQLTDIVEEAELEIYDDDGEEEEKQRPTQGNPV
jgi:hypothetical protein